MLKGLKIKEVELQESEFELQEIDFDFKEIEEIERPIPIPLSQEEEKTLIKELKKYIMPKEKEKEFKELISENLKKIEKDLGEILDETAIIDFNFKE